jgi:hypothetical protein
MSPLFKLGALQALIKRAFHPAAIAQEWHNLTPKIMSKIDPKKLSEARLLRRQGASAMARATQPALGGTAVGSLGRKSLSFRPKPLAA